MPDTRRAGVAEALVALTSVALVSGCGASSTATSTLHVTRLANAKTGAVSLSGGWVLAPEGAAMANMPGMDQGSVPLVAVYGDLRDAGSTPVALTKVIAPRGARAQLHVTSAGSTSGTMRRVDRLEIPAGQVRRLTPGGAHVMISGLHPSPVAGKTLTLIFVFSNGAKMTVRMPVIAAEDRPS